MSSKKVIGNGKKIQVEENRENLTVVGNGCQVKIGVNTGILKVVGDCCTVEVTGGRGAITLIGNDGRLKIGGGVCQENVLVVGSYEKNFGRREPPKMWTSKKVERGMVNLNGANRWIVRNSVNVVLPQ